MTAGDGGPSADDHQAAPRADKEKTSVLRSAGGFVARHLDLFAFVGMIGLQVLAYRSIVAAYGTLPGLRGDDDAWSKPNVLVSLLFAGCVFILVRKMLRRHRQRVAAWRSLRDKERDRPAPPFPRGSWLWVQRGSVSLVVVILTVCFYIGYRFMFETCVYDLGPPAPAAEVEQQPGDDEDQRESVAAGHLRYLIHPPWRPAALREYAGKAHGESLQAYATTMQQDRYEFHYYLTIEAPIHTAATTAMFFVLLLGVIAGYAASTALMLPLVELPKAARTRDDEDASDIVEEFLATAIEGEEF